MLALIAMLTIASVQVLPTATFGPREWVDLDHDADHAVWEDTCFGYGHDAAQRRFDRVYGRRLARVKDYVLSLHSDADVKAAYDAQFGEDSIMVGGCPADRRPREERFAEKLKIAESAIASAKRR